MGNNPILFEEGQIKIKWEDIEINIPFNFENPNEIVLYKFVRGMQSQINNLENEMNKLKQNKINKLKQNKINIIEDSLKELWENEYDDRWSVD
jgi:hypothetical protein